jgi:aryl-alcohol dehydrogenase-like predicted oxidoreductase
MRAFSVSEKMQVTMREIGQSGIMVTPVAMGCWPIAGMTSLDVNEADSLATLQTALDSGINFFDTAYCYGMDGLSEKLIAQAFRGRREKVVIATKCGIHFETPTKRVQDARPATIRKQVEESLRRLECERVELLYLHAHDGITSPAASAAELRKIWEEGKAQAIGVSNLSVAQMEEFLRECPISAVQPHYNMLQREIETEILPWCLARTISLMVYWPLLKGLLAGKLPRDFQFQPGDGRAKYPMFQGAEWEKNQDLVDELRTIAAKEGKTVAQLVVNWTIHQPGITVALCGAKRPSQIAESAGALGWKLSESANQKIAVALQQRGVPITTAAV